MAGSRNAIDRSCALVILMYAALSASAANRQSDHDLRRVSYWSAPVSGSWFTSTNWEDSQPPLNRVSSAIFDVGASYEVTIPQELEIADLYLLDAQAVLSIDPRVSLTVFDRVVNNGRIKVNTGNDSGIANFAFEQDTLISGHGTIELNATSVAEESQISTQGNLVTIGPDQTITGTGLLKGLYLNLGQVFVERQGDVGLDINFSFSQSDDGLVSIQDSKLRLRDGASLNGGLFSFGDNGVLSLDAGSSFMPAQIDFGTNTSVTINSGEVEYGIVGQQPDLIQIMSDGATCVLNNDITMNGAIQINTGEMNGGAILEVDTDVSISGVGEIELLESLFGSQTAAKVQAVGNGSLTIGSGIDLFGSGVIAGLDDGVVINNGLVRVPSADHRILLAGRIGGGLYEIDAGVLSIGSNATVIDAHFIGLNGGYVEAVNCELMNPVFAEGTDLHVDFGEVTVSGNASFASDIHVDTGSPSADGVLMFNNYPSLDGYGTIKLGTNGTERDSFMMGQAFIPESFPIVGSGYIEGTFVIESVVRADNPSQPLFVRGVANRGTFIADHAELWATGEHANGEFISDGGMIRLASAEFINATIRKINGGDVRLVPDANLTLASCYAEVSLDICDESEVIISGTTELHGTHSILDRGLLLLSSPILTGSGDIIMRGTPKGTVQPTVRMSGTAGMIGEGIPIHGSGRINSNSVGRFASLSEIVADDPFSSMRLGGNIGPVASLVTDGGSFLLENGLSLGETTIESFDGGLFEFDEGDIELHNLTSFAALRVSNGNTNVEINGTIYNHGSIYIGSTPVGAGATMGSSGVAEILGDGTIELSSIEGLALPNLFGSQRLTLGPGQLLVGDGRLGGTIELHGRMNPGGTLRKFEIARIVMAESTQIHLDIDGLSDDDFDYIRLLAGGWAELKGSLSIDFGEDFEPALGNRWFIFQGGDVRGQFDQIAADTDLPYGWVFQVIPNANGAELVITCRGDRNGDGARDFFDVVDFINAFNQSDPTADVNGDGVINFFDVGDFIQDFQSECAP